MARPELGIKWQCQSCGAKFYDLGRAPPVCPKCGTVQQPIATTARARPEPVAASRSTDVEGSEAAEAAGVELVSLEEADEGEETGAVAAAKIDDEEAGEDESDDTDTGTDDDSFLEDEEDDDNVAGLIDGDLDDDEES